MSSDANNRAAAIQTFVERLVQVREDAGRPSFRAMAQRSGAISHATMHDAVQGTRLPSWETTVEFAKACGVHPRELRPDWDRASVTIRKATARRAFPEDVPDIPAPPASIARMPDAPAPAAPGSAQTPTPAALPPAALPPNAPVRSSRSRMALVIATSAAIAIVVVLGLPALAKATFMSSDAAAMMGTGSTPAPMTGEAASAYTSAASAPSTTVANGCPGNAPLSRVQEPRVDGDRGQFVGDVTIPDCSVQPRGQSIIKTWKLKNSGTVPWQGRFLHRINVHEGSPDCRAPELVAIPDTMPGATVNVSVAVATPHGAATCFARWMQVDSDGNLAFPMQRPYFYSFFVK